MSDCKAYRREIDAAADGLPVSSDARAHLALCRACGEELHTRESLRALVGGLGQVEAPPDFEFRLRARMAAAKTGGGRFEGARWFYGFAPFAVAACFVVVTTSLYFRQAPQPPAAVSPVVASMPARSVEPAAVSRERQAGPAVENREAMQEGRTNVALSAAHRSAPESSTSGRQVREVAFRGARRAGFVQRTAVSSFTAARVLRPVTITLKAPAEPLRMILRDESGAARVVPMRAVSFGSQNVLSREPALRPASAVEVGGVW